MIFLLQKIQEKSCNCYLKNSWVKETKFKTTIFRETNKTVNTTCRKVSRCSSNKRSCCVKRNESLKSKKSFSFPYLFHDFDSGLAKIFLLLVLDTGRFTFFLIKIKS